MITCRTSSCLVVSRMRLSWKWSMGRRTSGFSADVLIVGQCKLRMTFRYRYWIIFRWFVWRGRRRCRWGLRRRRRVCRLWWRRSCGGRFIRLRMGIMGRRRRLLRIYRGYCPGYRRRGLTRCWNSGRRRCWISGLSREILLMTLSKKCPRLT